MEYTQEQIILYKGVISEFCNTYLNVGNNQIGIIIAHDGKSYSGVPFKTIDELLYVIKTYVKFTHFDMQYDDELTKVSLLEIGAIFMNNNLYFTNSVISYKKLSKLEMQPTLEHTNESFDIGKINDSLTSICNFFIEKCNDTIIKNNGQCAGKINSHIENYYNKIAASLVDINDKLLPTDKQKSEDGYSLVNEFKKIISDSKNDVLSVTAEPYVNMANLGMQDLSNNPVAQLNIQE